MTYCELPPVTEAHRLAAFEAMRWVGCTYEQAMRLELRRRLIECRAHAMRTAEWERTTQRTVVPVRRVRLGADGHPMGWCTQIATGPRVAITQPSLLPSLPTTTPKPT